ncbi:unnamed protein product, partial [Symbiodinium pilosum]
SGWSKDVQVEPGTRVVEILRHNVPDVPDGHRLRLVTETAEVLKPDSRVWEPQVLTLVQYKHVVQTSGRPEREERSCLRFVQIPCGEAQVRPGAFRACRCLTEV